MVAFLFSVHTITEAKQYAGLGRADGSSARARAVDLPAMSFDLGRPGVAPPLRHSYLFIYLFIYSEAAHITLQTYKNKTHSKNTKH